MKIRDLKTGRFYETRGRMEAARNRSGKMKGKVTSEQMKEVSEFARSPEALEKKSKALKAYYKANPSEFSRRIRFAYEKDPELREKRAKVMRISREDMENVYTDAENAELRRTSKDGKQVIKFVTKERPKQTGVETYDV